MSLSEDLKACTHRARNKAFEKQRAKKERQKRRAEFLFKLYGEKWAEKCIDQASKDCKKGRIKSHVYMPLTLLIISLFLSRDVRDQILSKTVELIEKVDISLTVKAREYYDFIYHSSSCREITVQWN